MHPFGTAMSCGSAARKNLQRGTTAWPQQAARGAPSLKMTYITILGKLMCSSMWRAISASNCLLYTPDNL